LLPPRSCLLLKNRPVVYTPLPEPLEEDIELYYYAHTIFLRRRLCFAV
jgi:hypothetical protein